MRAKQADDLGSGLGRQCVAAQSVHIISLNHRIRLVVLLPDFCLQFFCHGVDPLQVHAHRHQRCLAGTGNGIVLGTAGQSSQAQGHQFLNPGHEFAHNLVGVGPVLVNFRTGMTALQTVNHQPDAGAVNSPPFHRQRNGGSCTAGTGDGEHALPFRIHIHQTAAAERGQIDGICSQQTDFLIGGNNHFQRRMGDGGIGQHSQSHCHRDTVIGAQGCTLGEHHFVIMGNIQALSGHVNVAVGILLTDHIHMALKHYRQMVLHTAGTIGKKDDVVRFILNIFKAMFLRKRHQIIGNHFGIP